MARACVNAVDKQLAHGLAQQAGFKAQSQCSLMQYPTYACSILQGGTLPARTALAIASQSSGRSNVVK